VPRWAAEAVERADIVVVALAFRRFHGLVPGRLPGKLVVGGGDGAAVAAPSR
jgi:hypothetical protein